MIPFGPRRKDRYKYLLDRHFTPLEAREFSKLEEKYPALVSMLHQRAGQWGAFNRKAKKKGWDDARRHREWLGYLARFYSDRRFLVRRNRKGKVVATVRSWVVRKNVHGRQIAPKPSPWDWYDATFQRLPDQQKWDSPRSHRSRTAAPHINLGWITKSRWVAELNRSLADAIRRGETDRANQLREQIIRIRRTPSPAQ